MLRLKAWVFSFHLAILIVLQQIKDPQRIEDVIISTQSKPAERTVDAMDSLQTGLDPLEILQWLKVEPTAEVTRVQGGMDAAIWRVETAHGRYALRVLKPAQAKSSRLEAAAMTAARNAGVATPKVEMFDFWQGHPVMLLEWLPGTTLLQAVQNTPLVTWALGVQFGRLQAEIHRIPVPPELLTAEHEWIGWAANQELEDRLRSLKLKANALLHLDYHAQNVMSDGRRLTGVIDWANVRAGDPRADFARTYTILRVEPWSPTFSPKIEIFRRVFAAAWQRGYEQVAGKLQDMPLFFAWAGLAMANDLSPRIDKTESWFRAEHIESIRRWAQQWLA